jgi:hypothetical protein
VITSVNRDDDLVGGARVFAMVIDEIRRQAPGCRVEVLIPDFQGNREAIRIVVDARPEVLNHNTESVPRLYRVVRSGARYERTLELLRYAKELNPAGVTKSGVMVGLGEETASCLKSSATSPRPLRHSHHRPVPAPLARPPADGAPLHAARVRRAQDRSSQDGLPPRRIRPAGPLQLSRHMSRPLPRGSLASDLDMAITTKKLNTRWTNGMMSSHTKPGSIVRETGAHWLSAFCSVRM